MNFAFAKLGALRPDRQETTMEPMRAGFLISLWFIFATCALAEDGKAVRRLSTATSALRPALTGKERLGPKWSDEQRIDNCHVPIDKRGTKPRPSACPNAPSS
jgi:hypothetical protein